MRVAVVLLVVLFFAGSSFAFPTEKGMQTLFSSWMREHGRSYSAGEFQGRYANFKTNVQYIDAMNKQNLGFTLGTNKFSDMTFDEFKSFYLGYVAPQNEAGSGEALPSSFNRVDEEPQIPANVDWRTKGVVTGVKNQGQCGSCWSFSTTGSLEGAHALKTGRLVPLSEQNLVDCSTSEGNHGCAGGSMDLAFRYVIRNGGIDTEASYPYTARDGSCHYSRATCGSRLAGYRDVPSGNENELAVYVADQPVSVAIDATQALMSYRSGVFYDPSCSSTSLNHGVLAVGYAPDHWIVKNSWGTDWGMHGYVWMARNRNNNCGIATAASVPERAGATDC